MAPLSFFLGDGGPELCCIFKIHVKLFTHLALSLPCDTLMESPCVHEREREREGFFRSSRHAELMEVILHPNEITMVLDRTHTCTHRHNSSVALLPLCLSLCLAVRVWCALLTPFVCNFRSCIAAVTSRQHIVIYQISWIAGTDFISTFQLV